MCPRWIWVCPRPKYEEQGLLRVPMLDLGVLTVKIAHDSFSQHMAAFNSG
jgi:hypothetical protein